MGEVLILIIIALVWGFKAAVANEDKKVNDRETSSATPMSAHTAKSAGRSRAGSRPTAVRSILSTWTAARTGSKA